MTELERLVRQIRVHYPVTLSLNEENDLVEMLNRKYSVSLRNTDSSADNTSVDQLHSDKELMSKIEDLTVDLHNSIPLSFSEYNLKKSFQFEDFQKELKTLFQTHRNTVSTAVKQKDDNLVDETELVGKIKSIAYEIDRCESRDIYWTDYLVEETIKLIKTYQNSVLRPVNNSDE